MKSPLVLSLLFFASFLAGCVSVDQPMAVFSPRTEVTLAKTSPQIYLDHQSSFYNERISPMAADDDKGQIYATGPVWGSVFTGAPESPAKIKIKSSRLEERMVKLGFSVMYTYKAEAILIYHDQAFYLSAEGKRSAAMDMPAALRQSIERAVMDMARQAETIIRKQPQPAPGAM